MNSSNDPKNMIEYQKAAIILKAMGLENAKHLLKSLDRDDIKKIYFWVERINLIPQKLAEESLNEFFAYSHQTNYPIGFPELKKEKTIQNAVIYLLNKESPLRLAEALSQAKISTLTYLLSLLTPKRATEILMEFSSEKIEETLISLSKLHTITDQKRRSLEENLALHFGPISPNQRAQSLDPSQFAKECLQLMPTSVRTQVLNKLSSAVSS